MTTVPAGCPARLHPSSERKAGATEVHLGIELIGNPLTRDGSAPVKVRVGSSFPLNGVLILLDEGFSSEEPRRATRSAAVRSHCLSAARNARTRTRDPASIPCLDRRLVRWPRPERPPLPLASTRGAGQSQVPTLLTVITIVGPGRARRTCRRTRTRSTRRSPPVRCLATARGPTKTRGPILARHYA